MDAQDFRSLQEAYMEVVENQQLDESSRGDDEYERQYSHKVSRGMKKPKPHSSQTLEGEKNTTGKYAAMQRRKRQGLSYREEQVDIYDIILSHLLDEGYAETVEAAEVMMVNMSEEWRDEILDEKADSTVMSVKSPSGETKKVSKLRHGRHNPENPEEIANRRSSQRLSDRENERQERMRAGRLTVATKRGIEAATNRSNDGVGGNRFVQGSSLRARERDDVPTDYRARRRRASGR